ncbi:MAG: alpha/beta hydrolase [Proteobacteria bacterium]|nr:alpha/beta hydrolase [Pseudomonadota bacterium]
MRIQGVLACFLLLVARVGYANDFQFHEVAAPDGVPLNVVSAGNPEGVPIVFLHGAYQSYLSFLPQLRDPALAAKYHLVAIDMRGHGGSGKPWDSAAYARSKPWADDIRAVVTALGLSQPVLVGWSFGGYVALDYVREYGGDALRGVVLIGSDGSLLPRPAVGGKQSGDLELLQQNAKAFMAVMSAAPLRQDALDRGYAAYLMMPPYARNAMRGKRLDNTDLVATLRAPTLVVLGGKDPSVPIEPLRDIVAKIPASQLQVFENSGHSSFVEEAPRFNAALADFVQRQAVAESP